MLPRDPDVVDNLFTSSLLLYSVCGAPPEYDNPIASPTISRGCRRMVLTGGKKDNSADPYWALARMRWWRWRVTADKRLKNGGPGIACSSVALDLNSTESPNDHGDLKKGCTVCQTLEVRVLTFTGSYPRYYSLKNQWSIFFDRGNWELRRRLQFLLPVCLSLRYPGELNFSGSGTLRLCHYKNNHGFSSVQTLDAKPGISFLRPYCCNPSIY